MTRADRLALAGYALLLALVPVLLLVKGTAQ